MSIDTSYWLISGYSSESTSYSYFVYRVNHDSSGIYLTANYSSDTRNYMRPVFYLKSSIHFNAGDGSKNNPYIID